MIRRETYLQQLAEDVDNEFIKVITGVRRSGKSVLMTQTREMILERSNVNETQIVAINFESFQYADLAADPKKFYNYLVARSSKRDKMYYFF
jgi:predicted AAA+ superfamily ATPase